MLLDQTPRKSGGQGEDKEIGDKNPGELFDVQRNFLLIIK